ncbi:DUF2637 domain-containing protein [Streptomyces sp. NPDC001142]
MTAWDRTAIILLGSAGFAFSYDALRQIAIAIHAREALSYLFPVFIDGFIAYGVRAIVLLRHRRFGARAYAWSLFLAATGASLGANALHAITLNHGAQAGRSALHLGDSVVGVLSTLAPLALAGSVHLYILMARTAELSVRDGADDGPGPVRRDVPPLDNHGDVPEPRTVKPEEATEAPQIADRPSEAGRPAQPLVDLRKHGDIQASEPRTNAPAAHPSAAADRTDEVPNQPDGPPVGPADGGDTAQSHSTAERPAPKEAHGPADGEESPVPDDAGSAREREVDDEWLDELLPIARTASEKAGRISREAVKEAVRAHQPISNDRLGLLLARLKDEEDASVKTVAVPSSALW